MNDLYKLDLRKISIVSILFWGRSGTLFMGSLLDSHHSILTIPESVMSNYFDRDGFWKRNEMKSDYQLMLDAFCEEYSALFAEDFRYGAIKIGEFKAHMEGFITENEEFSRRSFFIYIHFSYALCLNQDIRRKSLINFQMHDSSVFTRMNELLRDFEDAKFIGMYRYPIRALHSHMRHHKDNINEYLDNDEFSKIYQLYTWLKKPDNEIDHLIPKSAYSYVDEVIDGQYLRYYTHQLTGWKKAVVQFDLNLHSVGLESLHDKPHETMESVADYLQIEFRDSLLKSTFNGIAYTSDKRSIQKIQGFSSDHTRMTKYQESFNEVDVYVINNIVSLLYPEYHHLKDESLELDSLIDLLNVPTKTESLAIEKTFGTDHFETVMTVYKDRVLISKRLLTQDFKSFALEGFYR